MIHGRLRRRSGGGDHVDDAEFIEIEPGEFAGMFAAPRWLRDLGLMAWLLVGVAAFLAGAVWLLALTQTIVIPVVTAAILAAVISPVMGFLERRWVRRGLGTGIVLLAIVALGALVVLMVVGGISSQADDLTSNLQAAADKIQGWLEDLGGATLGLHPLAVLVVTIAAGSLFGTIGLVLAAPLTAAGVRISADLARAREKADAGPAGPASGPQPGRADMGGVAASG